MEANLETLRTCSCLIRRIWDKTTIQPIQMLASSRILKTENKNDIQDEITTRINLGNTHYY